jgi:hypothetical protein
MNDRTIITYTCINYTLLARGMPQPLYQSYNHQTLSIRDWIPRNVLVEIKTPANRRSFTNMRNSPVGLYDSKAPFQSIKGGLQVLFLRQ